MLFRSLLLDDVFDKLDLGRVENLLNLVSDSTFGQIFISDSNKVRLDAIINRVASGSKIFRVINGSYKELTDEEGTI